MKGGSSHPVFGALAGVRGHRSLDDAAGLLAEANAAGGKRQGFGQKPSGGRGWNTSTRASPAWKRKSQENKENSKAPVPKKYLHIASSLQAPIFRKRASLAEASANAGVVEESYAEDGPLRCAPGLGNMGNTWQGSNTGANSLQADARPFAPPAPPFVTTRRGSMLASPFHGLGAASPSSFQGGESLAKRSVPIDNGLLAQGVSDAATLYTDAAWNLQADMEECRLRRTPSPRISSHPSVAALYQFAQEVRTPVSCTSKPVPSNTPPECADMVLALEGAAQGVESDVSSEELCGSFRSWLTSMGLDAAQLPEVALTKMRGLWEKAKEATQLQALVEQLKESELQLAQQEVEDNARHVGMLLAENQDLLGVKAQLQEQLAEAKERLAELASAPTFPAPDFGLSFEDLEERAEACKDPAEPSPRAHSWAYHEQRDLQFSSGGRSEASFVATAVAGPASPLAAAATSPASGAASVYSVSLGSLVQPGVGVGSPVARTNHSPPGFSLVHSPSDSVNGPPRFADTCAGATPGLSIVSNEPERIPFADWATGLNDAAATAPASSPAGAVAASTHATDGPVLTVDGTGPFSGLFSPSSFAHASRSGSVHSPSLSASIGSASASPRPSTSFPTAAEHDVSQSSHATFGFGFGHAQSCQPSPQQSAGLSMISQPVGPVGFADWSAAHPEPKHEDSLLCSAAASPSASVSMLHSPQLSAGLSVVSGAPAAVPFGAWANVQREHSSEMPSAESESLQGTSNIAASAPSFSADPRSPPPQQPAAGPDSLASTPAARSPYPAGSPQPVASAAAATPAVADKSPAAQLRSNPLFEYDSPAPITPGTQLPVRSDALLGPVAPSEPSPGMAFPSLASTPMTQISDGLRSPGAQEPFEGAETSSPAGTRLGFAFGAGSDSRIASPTAGPFGTATAVAFDFGDMASPPTATIDVALPMPASASAAATMDPRDASNASASPQSYEGQAPCFAAASLPASVEDCSADVANTFIPPGYSATPEMDGISVLVAPVSAVSPSRVAAVRARSQCSPRTEGTSSVILGDMPSPVAAGAAAPSHAASVPAVAFAGVYASTAFAASPQPQPERSAAAGPQAQTEDAGFPAAVDAASPTAPLLDMRIGGPSPLVDNDNMSTPSPARAESKWLSAEQKVNVAFPAALSGSPGGASPLQSSHMAIAHGLEPQSGSNSASKLDAGMGGDSRATSYPNTPSGAWPASPTSTMYATPLEAFATPASLASFYSAAHLNAMRLYSGLQLTASAGAANAAALNNPTPTANFSFGFGAGGAAATPALAMGVPVAVEARAGTDADDAATPSPRLLQQHITRVPWLGFGSPLPLMHLTPVQMRAIDQLASQVLAAMSPSVFARGSPDSSASSSPAADGQEQLLDAGTDAASPAVAASAASPAGFNFAEMLAQLQSPLPAPMQHHLRRSVAPSAGPHEEAASGSNASPPSAAGAAAGVPSAAFNFAAMLAQLHSPLPAPMQHHMRRSVAPSAGPHEEPSAGSDASPPAAASAAATAPVAAFNLAAMLSQLHSPLPAPMQHAARRGAAAAGYRRAAPQVMQSAGQDSRAGTQESQAGAEAVEPAADVPVQGAEVLPSMPAFAQLMSFLNAAGRPPAATVPTASDETSSPRECQAALAEASAAAAHNAAVVTAAAVSFAHLLANLQSPLPQGHGPMARAQPLLPPGAAAAIVLGIPMGADSPAGIGAGAHDSPANSEAASFGFSTAAKLSTRATPATTPGGGGSFMRWAREAAPPTFRLDSDIPGGAAGRGRTSRTPPTPVSFSFGAPAMGAVGTAEEQTPAVGGRGRPYGAAERDDHSAGGGVDLASLLHHASLSPQPPNSGAESATAGSVEGHDLQLQPSAVRVGAPAGPAAGAHSPALSFGFNFDAAMAAAIASSPAFIFGGGNAASPHSPAFLFGGPNGAIMSPHSPAFTFGGGNMGAVTAAASPHSPAFTFGGANTDAAAASPHSPAFMFGGGGNMGDAAAVAAVAHSPAMFSQSPAFIFGTAVAAAAAASSPHSPAFSFGHQLGGFPAQAGTPMHMMGARQFAIRNAEEENEEGAAAPTPTGASPAPSLGMWGFMPHGTVGGSYPGGSSPAPSELSFAFGNAGGCAMGTPVLAGMAGVAAEHASPASRQAWEQFAAMSPTMWGLAPAGDAPEDTPGVTQRPREARTPGDTGALPSGAGEVAVAAAAAAAAAASAGVPGAAAFWSALIGCLHSPMPVMAHTRRYQLHDPAAPPLPALQQQLAAMDPPSLDTLPTAPSSVGTTAAVASASAAIAAASGSTFSFTSGAAPAGSTAGVQAQPHSAAGASDATPDVPPPSYEDLPDLISRGLCLSASASLPLAAPSRELSKVDSALQACSSVGENGTPFLNRMQDVADSTSVLLAAAALSAAAHAAACSSAVGSPDVVRLFTPTRRCAAHGGSAVGSASADLPLPLIDPLVLESISDSSRSGTDLASQAGAAGHTTDAVPTPSRLGHTTATGRSAVIDAGSAHSSPVLSFGIPACSGDANSVSSSPQPSAAQLPPLEADAATPVAAPRHRSAGAGSPQLHVVVSPAAASPVFGCLSRSRAASPQLQQQQLSEEGVLVVELGDVRESIRGFVSSAASTPQQPAGSHSLRASSVSVSASAAQQGSMGFSADAVQRLLFATDADGEQGGGDSRHTVAPEGPWYTAGAIVRMNAEANQHASQLSPASSGLSADDTIEAPIEDGSDVGPLTYTVTAQSGSPVLSSQPSIYDGLPTPNCNTPFSNLGSGTVPATPLTAELASAGKVPGADAGALVPAVAPAGVHHYQQQHGATGGGSHQFWAPSVAGPSGTPSSERVTLEVLNRRISANTDLLLDFQGSPGRPLAGASATGANPPRLSSPGQSGARPTAALFTSPSRKSNGGGPSHGPVAGPAAGPAPSATAPIHAAASAAPTGGELPANTRARMLLAGQGVPVQQLVAASLGNTFVSAAAAVQPPGMHAAASHLPLSHRLGLWSGAAMQPAYGAVAWGVPCAWPTMHAPAPAAAAGAVPVTQPQQQPSHARAEPTGASMATPVPQALPKRPSVTNRDQQTTPSLVFKPTVAPGAQQRPQQQQAAASKPVFRSRIPTPGSSTTSSASGAAAPAPAANSTVTSGARTSVPRAPVPLPPNAAATITPAATVIPAKTANGGSSSDDESGMSLSSPVERVVRRRRLLTSAAGAGGPQRVPVKRPAGGPQRGSATTGAAAAGVGEDEVRRRAHVLGMRISPYLRPKRQK